ncbi:putative maltokinase [bacterium]|nr:putative maltokinase [bacterium]
MGDNYYLGDRNGVRTPMQWSSDRNAGFSRANPHKLYLPVIIDPAYHYEAVNVENQQTSSASLLWWMKQTIAVRKRYRAFSRGTLVFLMPENPKIVSFLRIHESQVMFVAVNLSKFSQTAEFDLTGYSGYVPEEVFSNNAFPPIKEEPYTLTFAPFGYYIFELKREEVSGIDAAVLPELRVKNSWENVFAGAALEKFERRILPAYLKQRRWFGGKARTIRQVRILEKIPVRETIIFSYFLIIEVKYSEGMPEKYVLPLSFASHGVIGSESGEFVADGTAVRVDNDWLRSQSEHILQESSEALISKIYVDGEEGFLFDSLYNPGCRDRILSMISRKKRLKGEEGEIFTIKGKLFPTLLGENPVPIESRVMKADHSNTALIYGDRFFFKLYRRTAEGLNPDMEIIRFLTEKTKFTNIPPFAGAIEYRGSGRSPYVIGILQGFVQNQGDTWTYSQDAVKRCFERLLAKSLLIKPQELNIDIFDFDKTDVSPELQEIVGGIYLEMVRLLGERTAELHLALSSSEDDPDFTPEPFSLLYQRSLYQSLRSLTKKVLQPFEKKIRKLPEGIREEAKTIAAAEKDIIKYYEKILGRKFAATKMRIHGDYHLGQVLYTGKDFIVIDFEGEPARALSERKLKRSPLVDIAGMLRSFHYAVHAEYFSHIALRPEDAGELALWLDPWYKCICKVFLNAYVSKASSGNFLPKDMSDFKILLEVFMLEKAVYELGYELNNRPEWLVIPFQGIKSILGLSGAGEKKE